MPAARGRDETVAALKEAFEGFVEFGRTLTEDEWHSPSSLPGWTIKDNYSHTLGAERSLFLGASPPEVEVADAPHLKNPIAKINEAWVVANKDRTGAEVLADLEDAVVERTAALDALTDEEFRAVGFTPAGEDEHGRFLQIRTFDIWMHEQDCREPLERPGHGHGPAVETAIDEFTTAAGFVVGKKAGATEGQSVRFELTGPSRRTIDVLVDGRARVVDHVSDPTTILHIPTLLWMRLAGGRRTADLSHPDITVEGDEDLAARVVGNAAYTI